MSASPFFLEDGPVTFSERRDSCYLSALNGEHKGKCKVRRLLTTWRLAVQLECHSEKLCRTLLRTGKWRQSLKMRGNLAEGREQELWQLAVLDWNLSPSFCWSAMTLKNGLGSGTSLIGSSWVLVILGMVPGTLWVSRGIWCWSCPTHSNNVQGKFL